MKNKAAVPDPGRPQAGRQARVWAALALILLFSTALGALSVWQYRDHPGFNLPILDEASYTSWARKIAGGDIVGDTIFYQEPLYPYFLALVFTVAGENLGLVRLLQVLLGTAAIGLTFLAGRRLLGDWPALLCAGIMALCRGVYFFELLLLKATLVIFLSALCCFLGVEAAARPRSRGRFLGLGLCLGLLTLLRGNFLVLLPFAVAWAWLGLPGVFRERLLRSALCAGGIALVIVPVAVRNLAVGGELVLTTSQGGANFYIGNNPRADGLYVNLDFVRPEPRWEAHDFKAEAEKRVGRSLSPSQVSRFWFEQGLKWIAQNPGPAGRLWAHKARLIIHDFEVADNHSYYLTRDYFVPALWAPLLGFGLLWGPALIGMAVMVRRDRRSWYPALFALLYLLSLVPFYVVARYRVAAVPAMCLFAAGFAAWALEKLRAREWRPLELSGAVLGLSLLLGFAPTRESRWPQPHSSYDIGNSYLDTGKFREAVFWYDKALLHLPNDPDVLANRERAVQMLRAQQALAGAFSKPMDKMSASELLKAGKELDRVGEVKLAVDFFEAALVKDPGLVWVRGRLGYIYRSSPAVKDLDKAIFHLRAGLEQEPGNPSLLNSLGNAYIMAGNTIEARRSWEKALAQDPDYAPARQNLEMLSGGAGRQ